jgi:hypothetical protein
VPRVLLALTGPMELTGLMELMVLRVLRVLQVPQVPQVLKVHRVFKVLPEPQVQLEQQERPVLQAIHMREIGQPQRHT